MKNTISERLAHLKRTCPMPVLMEAIRLGSYAKPCCCSPFRSDQNPSWGIYRSDRGSWHFKDHATNESGDEITLLAKALQKDQIKDFLDVVEVYETIAAGAKATVAIAPQTETEGPSQLPDRTGFGPGTEEHIARLSAVRGFTPETLRFLVNRGNLVFGDYHGQSVYGITDASGKSLELRRLDGQQFPAFGSFSQHKSHSVRHSSKRWPIGIQEVEASSVILLVEGLPDFIAGWQIIIQEDATAYASAVAMLGASNRISNEALPLFKGRHVRIVHHCDSAGQDAAEKVWGPQLVEVGASKVDLFRLSALKVPEGFKVKDVDDIKRLHAENMGQPNWRFLP